MTNGGMTSGELPIGRNFVFVGDDLCLEFGAGQIKPADLGQVFRDFGHLGGMLRTFGDDFVQILHPFVEPFGLRAGHGGRVVAKIRGGGLGARLDIFGRLDRRLFLFGCGEEQAGQLAVIVPILLAHLLLAGFFVLDFLIYERALLGALLLIGLELIADLLFGLFVVRTAAGLFAQFSQELTLFGDRTVQGFNIFLVLLDLAPGGLLGGIAQRLAANDVVGEAERHAGVSEFHAGAVNLGQDRIELGVTAAAAATSARELLFKTSELRLSVIRSHEE